MDNARGQGQTRLWGCEINKQKAERTNTRAPPVRHKPASAQKVDKTPNNPVLKDVYKSGIENW